MKLVVHRVAGFGVLLSALALVGCTGGSSPNGVGDGDNGGGGSSPPVNVEGACALPVELLPPRRVIRLSPLQYVNALKANFNYKMEASSLPSDASSGGGFAVFDTNFADKQVTPEHFNVFRGSAEAVALETVKNPTGTASCLMTKPDDGCVDAFLADFGLRAFRRPLANDERDRYKTFFRANETKWDSKVATRIVVEVMLQSPNHLYRTELGSGDGSKVSLTQHELANQLSFMLADQAPDQELLAAANEGKLKDAAEVKKQAQRLAGRPEFRDRIVAMISQMYGLSEGAATGLAKDAAVFPAFTPALRTAMMKETNTFVDAVMQDGASLQTLYNADYSYLNKTLANHYGVDAAGLTEEFKKVSLPQGRRGLWGHASLLSVHAHKDGSSPALRGITVFTKLFCQPIPGAPPGAVDLAAGKIFAPDKNFTQREHYEFAKQKAPECVGCHGQFVPFGLGLEQFDGVGKQRTSEFGKTLDTSVELKGQSDEVDGSYGDTLQLIDKVVQSDAGARCFATQASAFALSKDVDSDTLDSCEIKKLASTLKDNDFSVTELMLNLTQVESFYNRRQGS